MERNQGRKQKEEKQREKNYLVKKLIFPSLEDTWTRNGSIVSLALCLADAKRAERASIFKDCASKLGRKEKRESKSPSKVVIGSRLGIWPRLINTGATSSQQQ